MLMAEIPGDDRYDAPLAELLEMVDILVGLQRRWAGREAELLALGLPDWRAGPLADAIGDVVERAGPELTQDVRAALGAFVADLPRRFAAIECLWAPRRSRARRFPPGNVRGAPGRLVLLDWGDGGVGHPLLDQPAFLTRIDGSSVGPGSRDVASRLAAAVPGSDPDRAARLLAPVAAARQAVIYRRFLDNIEPSEHAYHVADVPDWLRRTADLLAAEQTAPIRRVAGDHLAGPPTLVVRRYTAPKGVPSVPQSDLPIAELRAYTPALDVPADLDTFWASTLAEARTHDLGVTCTPVETGLTVVDTFDVPMPALAGRRSGPGCTSRRPNGTVPGGRGVLGYGGGRGLPTNGSCRRPLAIGPPHHGYPRPGLGVVRGRHA